MHGGGDAKHQSAPAFLVSPPGNGHWWAPVWPRPSDRGHRGQVREGEQARWGGWVVRGWFMHGGAVQSTSQPPALARAHRADRTARRAWDAAELRKQIREANRHDMGLTLCCFVSI